MPSPETLENFVALVEAGHTVEAMVRHYAEGATMRENMGAPRVGKARLIAHEEAALASLAGLKATCVRPFFVAGDRVVIRWVFEMHEKSGRRVRFEELAYQRWQDEQIVEEQFFYDPGQLKPARPTADQPAPPPP